jgi:ABC-2 type transport system ATP-binding protein
MISLLNLTKRFKDILAVDSLCLEIKKGELFGFLGPNGAGKTTTIKLMVGLLKPTKGQVLIGGWDIQEKPTLAKSIIGYIPDNPYLYEKLTGWEFLNFIADIYSLNGKERKEIDYYFDIFELKEYKDELIQNYSHGMRQKLIFSSIFLHHPKVIIIDEPMVGLDPRSSRLIKDILKKKREGGATIFISTHNLEVAEELCTRVGIIHKGRLVAEGNSEELLELAKIRGEGRLEEVFLELTKEKANERV